MPKQQHLSLGVIECFTDLDQDDCQITLIGDKNEIGHVMISHASTFVSLLIHSGFDVDSKMAWEHYSTYTSDQPIEFFSGHSNVTVHIEELPDHQNAKVTMAGKVEDIFWPIYDWSKAQKQKRVEQDDSSTSSKINHSKKTRDPSSRPRIFGPKGACP